MQAGRRHRVDLSFASRVIHKGVRHRHPEIREGPPSTQPILTPRGRELLRFRHIRAGRLRDAGANHTSQAMGRHRSPREGRRQD